MLLEMLEKLSWSWKGFLTGSLTLTEFFLSLSFSPKTFSKAYLLSLALESCGNEWFIFFEVEDFFRSGKAFFIATINYLTISNLFQVKTIFWYILIKFILKIKLLIRLLIKTIINRILIIFITIIITPRRVNQLIIISYLFKNNSQILLTILTKLVSLILTLISNYIWLKKVYYIYIIFLYVLIIVLLILYTFSITIIIPIVKKILYYFDFDFDFDFYFDFYVLLKGLSFYQLTTKTFPNLAQIMSFSIDISFYLHSNKTLYFTTLAFLILFLLIIFRILFLIPKLFPLTLTKYLLSVIPLMSISNNDNDNNANEENVDLEKTPTSIPPLQSLEKNSNPAHDNDLEKEPDDVENSDMNLNLSINENQGWINFNMNFNDLIIKDQRTYIQNKMELKGLSTNLFLIDYFIGSILKNTLGDKLSVDTFLNTNLNTILNDQRNIQLNAHSFVRTNPFLLNNSSQSYYSSLIPFNSDNAFIYELQEELNTMKEVKTISEYGV